MLVRTVEIVGVYGQLPVPVPPPPVRPRTVRRVTAYGSRAGGAPRAWARLPWA